MYFTMPTDWACCAYLRKSREDEEREKIGHFKTLERHQKIIEGMAEENNHHVVKWYRELLSGETISGRPEIKSLLADLVSGKWDAVYAIEASRLGRGGGSDQETIVNAFRYTNTWLITEEKNYDPNSKSDMTQLKTDLRKSEDELDDITTRLMRGKLRSAKEGRWQATGRTPYGWRAARIGGYWQLDPDENHPNMLRIYDLLENSIGASAVARIYEKEGIPTARGGYHWTAAAIRAIALNPANCGYISYQKHTTKRVLDPETFRTKKIRVQNDDPILVKGLHYGKGGISKERFEKITGRLLETAHIREGLVMKNPLSRLLKCGKCGYAMDHHMMKSGKDSAYFYTHKQRKSMTRPCDGCRGARGELVMGVLVSALREFLADVELCVGGEDRTSEYRIHISALKAELIKANTARSRAMEAYEAGAYSISEFKTRKEAIDDRIKEIEQSIADTKPPEYTQETVVSLQRCIEALLDDNLSAQAKNDVLKGIIRRIDYYNDTEPYVRDNKVRLDIFLR